MDNKEIRRKILEALYKHEEQNPGRFLPSGNLKKLVDIEEKKLESNVYYLKRGRYIEIREFLQGYHAKIANRGIDLVENNEEFNRIFPPVNITTIHNSKGVVVGSNNVEIKIDESINITDSFNEIYDKANDFENAEEIKERIKVIEEELKKDNINKSQIKSSMDWLKRNANWTFPSLVQILTSIFL